MTCRSSAVLALVALLGALVLVGCSDSKKGFVLKGSVSYQGKPLSSGMVRLHMAENRLAMAMIQPDGSFALYSLTAQHRVTGAEAGLYTILIYPKSEDQNVIPYTLSKKYTVAAGENNLTIVLDE